MSGDRSPAQPTAPARDVLDPGGVGVLAYLVGRLAKGPGPDNADVVAELLAAEVASAQLQPVLRQ